MSVEEQVAEAAIKKHTEAGRKYAELCALEIELNAGKAIQQMDATLRVMALPNPLNPEKPHSVTSADKQIETDPIYFAYLKKQWENVLAKETAKTETESARLTALLRVGLAVAAASPAPRTLAGV